MARTDREMPWACGRAMPPSVSAIRTLHDASSAHSSCSAFQTSHIDRMLRSLSRDGAFARGGKHSTISRRAQPCLAATAIGVVSSRCLSTLSATRTHDCLEHLADLFAVFALGAVGHRAGRCDRPGEFDVPRLYRVVVLLDLFVQP